MGNSEKESLVRGQSSREIIVRREAQFEVQEIFQYYEDKSGGLGFEFLRFLDASLQSVQTQSICLSNDLQRSPPRFAQEISLRAFLRCGRKSNRRDRLS